MQKQHRVRVGALDGEGKAIVLAAARPAARCGFRALWNPCGDSSDKNSALSAAVGGHFHRLGFEYLAVQEPAKQFARPLPMRRCWRSPPARALSSGRRSCAGAVTLSTIQFGSLESATGWKTRFVSSPRRRSANAGGIDDFCMSLTRCTSSGVRATARWCARLATALHRNCVRPTAGCSEWRP